MAGIEHDFVERVAHFGPDKALIGIVAQPAGPFAADRLSVVILNTGTIHRVGHHRMYVALSRRLAQAGLTVLRFDFSGLGDSATHRSKQPLLQSNFADIGSALSWLEKTQGISRCILVGLCSGADHAILYGFSDPRVIGSVLIDPYIPPTARYFVDYASRRLRDVRSWRNFRLHKSKLMRRLVERFSYGLYREKTPQHLAYQGLDARASLEEVYDAAVKASIKLLVICTGRHHAPRQTYREQFINAFSNVSFGGSLRLEFFQDADHTFSSAQSRKDLEDLVVKWCETTKFERSRSKSTSTVDVTDLWIA
ncbi:alpha/beta fold hydrolase [Bradyrhizobium sp. ORS 111]|uniref:alpha/beta fold hydrolase n=1 Tax=Bradyrhizobium sp. ORS 111 TaxID=1685958 RepID=UPI00388EE665